MRIERFTWLGGALVVLMIATAGCSDSGTSQSDTSAAEEQTGFPDDRTVTGATTSSDVDRDPTPQTSTGGEIPGGGEAGGDVRPGRDAAQ